MEKVEMGGNGGSSLVCFLIGVVSGAAFALLLAPLSGVETRSLIGRKVKDGEDWVRDKAAEAEDFVVTHGAGLRDGVKKAAEVITQR